jgi:hypothetical protein
MEQIPVFFDLTDRAALILKPKKPFLNWLVSHDPKDKDVDLEEDQDVYLIPEFYNNEEFETWIKEYFDAFFCDQMNHWYTDETMWVQNRTFKLFKEWFDYRMHSMVWDTLDDPIEKE